jgi:hypothetical protein
MKQVLLISAVAVVFSGSAQAGFFGGGDGTGRLLRIQQFSPGDDDEVIRPGPRGDDGEPIELAPPEPDWGDDEMIEPRPQPGPPSDGDIDE